MGDVQELFLPLKETGENLKEIIREKIFIETQHRAANARFWRYLENKIPECKDLGVWNYDPDTDEVYKMDSPFFPTLNTGGDID